ncbi:MAG TPA: hypothetical protein VLD38_03705 [Nitrosopumilaceae archaeon]|nr:hypothetical protein [Nitrosopumilaceae archaeon]
MKKIIIFSISCIAAISLILGINEILSINGSEELCANQSLFEVARKNSPQNILFEKQNSSLHLDNSGSISYLYDNFDSYSENQKILDDFEKPNTWTVNGAKNQLKIVDEYYGGSGASAYSIISPKTNLSMSKQFEDFQNLNRWKDSGYITMWIKIENPSGIDAIDINFKDELGNIRQYQPLQVIHSSEQNTFGNDKDYPDLFYPVGDHDKEMWTDFILAYGWNYLLWRADEFTDNRNLNMSRIHDISINVRFNENLTAQTLIFDDLRIQDGLQKENNPTHGAWYSPHGRPQYGVYDIDKSTFSDYDYDLRLLNVRNTQYLTNGDHARMISSAPVPQDFAMRVKFTFTQLGIADKETKLSVPFGEWIPSKWLQQTTVGQRNNTYFRVVYDFEPDWDPGHEGFGAYLSLQYNKFGLFAVWPVVRNIQQDQEPKQGDPLATSHFTPNENVTYQLDLVVRGQQASTTIYEVKDGCLSPQSSVGYVFNHPRHGLDKRYPFSIESTGNMRTIIHEVEMISLDNTT